MYTLNDSEIAERKCVLRLSRKNRVLSGKRARSCFRKKSLLYEDEDFHFIALFTLHRLFSYNSKTLSNLLLFRKSLILLPPRGSFVIVIF